MVLVDSSIWIDFLQHPTSAHADRLETLIRDHNRAVLCGVILQEVLQGIRNPRTFRMVRERLTRFPYLEVGKEVYTAAASLYRSLRIRGITVPAADVSIAALAISRDLPLYTLDDHFRLIAQNSRLVLYASPGGA